MYAKASCGVGFADSDWGAPHPPPAQERDE
jgi:hypothetical protein